MSTVSNRFYITALQDGTTLHGNLVSKGGLTQAWTGSGCVPDWTVAANQPVIYLTLLSGATAVTPSSDFTWEYNGVEIVFGADNKSTDGLFQKTTESGMPALKIINNLADAENTDVDTITFRGTYVDGSVPIAFASSIQVRITSMPANGYLGVIDFIGGVSNITEKGQTITAYGTLYNASGTSVAATTMWYLNDASTGTAGTTISGKTNAYIISEGDITDHATLRCVFTLTEDGSQPATAYAFVDDMQDPEFMYIQTGTSASSVGNGNAASLRKGQDAHFKVWVGTRENAAVAAGWENATYKVQVLNAAGEVYQANTAIGSISAPIAGDPNYYRNITKSASDNKASFYVDYNSVQTLGNNLTGIIIATV